MTRTSRTFPVLAAAVALAFGVAAVTDAFARGGGGGGSGGGGGPSAGGSGGGSSGGGSSGGGSGGGSSGGGKSAGGTKGGTPSAGAGGAGAGAGAKPKSNTGTTQGRGDYLETLQRDDADEDRGGFFDDATHEPVRRLRGADRGE